MMIRFYDNNDIMIYTMILWKYYIMVLQNDILYDDEMSWGHGDGYVVLRASIDGPVTEATYRETMIHSTEVV